MPSCDIQVTADVVKYEGELASGMRRQPEKSLHVNKSVNLETKEKLPNFWLKQLVGALHQTNA